MTPASFAASRSGSGHTASDFRRAYRGSVAKSLSAGLAVAAAAAALSRPALGQDTTRVAARHTCQAESLGTDTTVDTLFAWIPDRASFESRAEHEFWIQQLRAVLDVLEPLPLLGPRDRPAFREPVPPAGADRLQDAETLIWFQVRNDGRLAGLHLHNRSGWDLLDMALQRAVLRADSQRTLRPLPPGLVGQPVDIWLAVRMGRRQARGLHVPVARVRWTTPRWRGEESRPRLIDLSYHPHFPDVALRAGIGDELVMEFVVDTAGRAEPNSIIPLRAHFREFAEEAVKAIRSARFSPGRIGGCPVSVTVQMPVNFLMRGR